METTVEMLRDIAISKKQREVLEKILNAEGKETVF